MAEESGRERRFGEANALQRRLRLLGVVRPVSWLSARVLHHLDRPVLHLSGGRRSVTSLLIGVPLVELTTIGARSGEPRTVPLLGVRDGDRLVLVASNFGQRRNPGWYHNLRANPRCSVVVGGRRYEMEAYQAEGGERERLWDLDVSVYPPRSQYARRAAVRQIPVMVLRPAPGSRS